MVSAWLLPFPPFAGFDVLCLPITAVPVLAPASGLVSPLAFAH